MSGRDDRFDVVIPTIGRPSLATLLRALDLAGGPRPGRVVIVDDRPRATRTELELPTTQLPVYVVTSGGRGPAAARNEGWRRCTAPWIAFLDDDVVPAPDWLHVLAGDIADAAPTTAAVQGNVHVPVPPGRRLTDAERQVAALEHAPWITADMAIRRSALSATGGFDERFPRAYREDSELALRLIDSGWQLTRGTRSVEHPTRSGTWRTSITAQRGNADDALMRRLHGADWRRRAGAPSGMLHSHVVTAGVAAIGAAGLAAGRSRLGAIAGTAFAARTGRFFARRVVGGDRSPRELARMAVSSAAIPFAATWWAARGQLRARAVASRGPADRWHAGQPLAVLFDVDGTLVHDVPYNGDPACVAPVPGALEALDRLRANQVALGLVTNQSAIGRGLVSARDVRAVHARLSELLGPFDTVEVCPHAPAEGCTCRKPQPQLIEQAARRLGVQPRDCVVIGDKLSDVEAGLAAGARAVLVTSAPAPSGLGAATACDLAAAVDLVLAGGAS